MHGSFLSWFDSDPGSYFVLLITGFAVATAVAALMVRRVGENPDRIIDLGLAMLIAGVVGARLLHVVADGFFWDYVNLCIAPEEVAWPKTRISQLECVRQGDVWDGAREVCQPLNDGTLGNAIHRCTAWAQFWAGGLTYYGGLIAATGVAIWLCRRDRFPVGKAADASAMGMAVGLGFGRMGCLLAGCCFGHDTDVAWALSFPAGSAASTTQATEGLISGRWAESLPVHPTQIYESAGAFAIAAILIFGLSSRKRYDGHVFLAFVGLYAVLRFFLEFWRADDRGGAVGLSTSQIIGAVLVAGIVVFHFIRRRHLALRGGDT